MNQRRGKTHAASGMDSGPTVNLQQLIRTVISCQEALEGVGEDDAALRFEIFADYLSNDVAEKGKSIEFTTRMLGL